MERVLLLDAPGVLGWRRWREIGQEHGLGVITAALEAAMAAGALAPGPYRRWPTSFSARWTRRR